MKAVQILGDSSSPSIVSSNDLPRPTPKGAELLIQIHDSGITGDEVTWPEVYARENRIPGHDISGVISELGPDYTGPFKVGHEIFAMISAERGQGQAEYAICLPSEVTPKPKSISHEEAAALPIPLLTAWEALSDHGQAKAGMRVFITGASGSVGILAVQMAKKRVNAHVIALASAQHHETLRSVGADEVFDYKTPGWETQIGKVGLVFDTVGKEVLEKSWGLVEDNGILITIGDPAPAWAYDGSKAPEAEKYPNVRYKHFIVSPNGERLGQAGEMIDAGSVKPLAVKAFSIDDATEAWAAARQRGRGGKVVIRFVGN